MSKLKSRPLIICLLTSIISLSLSGCWNYRSLDQMNIIVGIAVDFDEEENLYDVSYEVASLAGANKESGVVGKLINAQGKTMFDTARNAKRREADRLFFGSPHILVISQKVAEEIGILGIVEWFLRDGECRETMCIAISQEESAQAILERPEKSMTIVSADIHDILSEDKKVTSTSFDTQIYQAFNLLKSPRKSVLLPALRKVKNEESQVPEVNGTAVIKGDKLVGFLSPEQSRYALFIENNLEHAVITLSMANRKTDDISLEIFKNSTKKSFTHKDGKIVVKIETETHVNVAENHSLMDLMDSSVIEDIKTAAEHKIEKSIKSVVNTMQHEFNTDVFGFGEMINKKNLKLWYEVSPMWEDIYPTLEVNVTSDVIVTNTSFTK